MSHEMSRANIMQAPECWIIPMALLEATLRYTACWLPANMSHRTYTHHPCSGMGTSMHTLDVAFVCSANDAAPQQAAEACGALSDHIVHPARPLHHPIICPSSLQLCPSAIASCLSSNVVSCLCCHWCCVGFSTILG